MGVALIVVPFFGGPLGITRRAFVLTTTAVAAPFTVPTLLAMPTLPAMEVYALIAKEAVLGLILGFGASGLFWAIQSAGELVDLQRGATSASVYNPLFGSIVSPMGNLFLRLTTVVFFATGGFNLFLSAVLTTYELYPVTQLLPAFNADAAPRFLGLMGTYFKLTILYAAPFLIVFLLTDLGLGLMNRFVPQLNIFFFSMPVKSALAIFLMFFYTTVLVYAMGDEMFSEASLLSFLKGIFQ